MDRLLVHENKHPIYEIVLKSSFEELRFELEKLDIGKKKACIVTDSNVGPLYEEEIHRMLDGLCAKVVTFQFEAGENHKNLNTIQDIYETLIVNQFDRKDLLIALGGGVVGDMTGYAAATYLRGVDFVQIPTSLLAQVDSSIGGKTGVDFNCYKNMVGAFHQPKLVYINLATLATLDNRQFNSGMAEIIKHGLIRNKGYYEWIKAHTKAIQNKELDILKDLVLRSCEIKQFVVENDPKEKGERALLNFGHTAGHAVEKLKDFQLLHGECVALGIVAASYLSYKRGSISDWEYQDIKNILSAYGQPVRVDGLEPGEILAATKVDKKMEAGIIKYVLLHSIGRAYICRDLTDTEIMDAISQIIK